MRCLGRDDDVANQMSYGARYYLPGTGQFGNSDTGQDIIQSTLPLTLNDTQDTFVFIENTYTSNGVYSTKMG